MGFNCMSDIGHTTKCLWESVSLFLQLNNNDISPVDLKDQIPKIMYILKLVKYGNKGLIIWQTFVKDWPVIFPLTWALTLLAWRFEQSWERSPWCTYSPLRASRSAWSQSSVHPPYFLPLCNLALPLKGPRGCQESPGGRKMAASAKEWGPKGGLNEVTGVTCVWCIRGQRIKA